MARFLPLFASTASLASAASLDPNYHQHYDKFVQTVFKNRDIEPEAAVWVLIALFKRLEPEFLRSRGLAQCASSQCGKWCVANALQACGRCRAARFCSPACFKAAWKREHKAVCTKADESDAPVADQPDAVAGKPTEPAAPAVAAEPKASAVASANEVSENVSNQ